jgi:LysR family transcriptional regulator, hydrogen peroxide-inducible genes activator
MAMITLRQLRYFVAVAGSGHFGRAADAVGVSQPALSMQLRDLEKELGGILVERGASGARLTELGREAAVRAVGILAAVRDLEEVSRAGAEILGGPVRLGVIPTIAPFLLPRLLTGAEIEYPALQLSVRETTTGHLVEELADGSLDAILASLPLNRDDFAESTAFDDPFLLAAPTGSKHAAQSPALAELIRADELLLLEDGHCLRDQALSVCHRIDPGRLQRFGATSLTTVVQLVAAGQGVTLVPQLAVDAGLLAEPRVSLVRFADPQPYRSIGLAWRRNSPRGRDFGALTALVRKIRNAEPSALAVASGGPL